MKHKDTNQTWVLTNSYAGKTLLAAYKNPKYHSSNIQICKYNAIRESPLTIELNSYSQRE